MTTTESMLYDIEQATARIREIYGKWENLRKAQQAYIDKLGAERDALQAQVDTLRDDWAGQILPVAIERDEARKERDALRAQLDNMSASSVGHAHQDTFPSTHANMCGSAGGGSCFVPWCTCDCHHTQEVTAWPGQRRPTHPTPTTRQENRT